MKKLTSHLLLLFSLFAMLTSCQKDNEGINPPLIYNQAYTGVDEALWPYFREFEAQGALRGLEIDLEAYGIKAEIRELSEEHVAGQCSYGSAIGSNIVIDQGFWDNFGSTYTREMVIFHELGHCYLHRDHREDSRPDGTCISIMRSGLEDCMDNYNNLTRATYLDELFYYID